MSELKPCPFCGSKAGLYWDEYRGDYKSPHATVDCLSDDCSASIELDDETIDSAKERVTAAWNSRAAQITPQAGEGEPVAWLYEPNSPILGSDFISRTKQRLTSVIGWTETPLYRTAPPSPVAPVWQPKTPKGWRFTTADFSMLPGRVMFIRDAAEKERWHELPDIDKEREDGPELYVSGSGMTLQEAFAKACAAAERAQPLPSPPDSPGAEKP